MKYKMEIKLSNTVVVAPLAGAWIEMLTPT